LELESESLINPCDKNQKWVRSQIESHNKNTKYKFQLDSEPETSCDCKSDLWQFKTKKQC